METRNLSEAIDFREKKYFIDRNDDKCEATIDNMLFDSVEDDKFYQGIVYRGITRANGMGFDLEGLLELLDKEKGISSAYFALAGSVRCNKAVSEAICNACGITGYHHTSTDHNIARDFAGIDRSKKASDDDVGIIMVIYVPARTGVDVNKFTGIFDSESEIAIPGFIHKKELLMAIEVVASKISYIWVNDEPIFKLSDDQVSEILAKFDSIKH